MEPSDKKFDEINFSRPPLRPRKGFLRFFGATCDSCGDEDIPVSKMGYDFRRCVYCIGQIDGRIDRRHVNTMTEGELFRRMAERKKWCHLLSENDIENLNWAIKRWPDLNSKDGKLFRK